MPPAAVSIVIIEDQQCISLSPVVLSLIENVAGSNDLVLAFLPFGIVPLVVAIAVRVWESVKSSKERAAAK